MANAYSTPINYGQTIPTTDLAQYLGTIQHGMQQKFDVNLAKIDELISKVSAVPLARDKDKRYLGEKLQNLLSVVDANSKIDLTDNVVARQITGQIASAIDENVRTQLQNSAKINSFNQDLTAMKAKKPELYNSANHAYALEKSGYSAYMNEQTDELGSISYSPYVDVTKSALDKIKQLKELRGKQEIDAPDPHNPGRTIKRTIDGLTEEEIFRYMPDILTSEEQGQLKINGWAKYKDNLPEAKQKFQEYVSTKTANIDEQIKYQEAIVKNTSGNSEKERKIAQLQLESLQKSKTYFSENLKNIDTNNAESVGQFLEVNSWKNGIASMAKAKESISYGKDDWYFEMEKLNIDRQKLDIEKAKLAKESGVDANGNPVVSPGAVSFSTREGALDKNLDPVGTLKKDYDQVYNEMVSSVKSTYQSEKIPQEVKTQFKAELKKFGYDENGAVINESLASKASKASAMKSAFDKSGMGIYAPQVAKSLSGLEVKRSGIASDFALPKRDALVETFNKDPEKYLTSLKDELSDAEGDSKSIILGRFLPERKKQYEKAKAFVEKNGGFSNLKSIITKDTKKLNEFSEILSGLTSQSNYRIGFNMRRQDLKKDSYGLANEKLITKTQGGRSTYFNTANVGNITDEKARERLVNMIPQTEDSQVFDAKRPISFYKNDDGSITITQNMGYSDNQKGAFAKKAAQVVVNKEDAPYKEVMRYVDLNESSRGLDAARTSIKVRPAVVPDYSDGSNKVILSRKDAALASLPPEVIKGFEVNPVNYLTESRSKETYKMVLKGAVEPQQAEAFVSKLADNLNFFKLEMKPVDGEWAISLKTNKGKLINEGGTGVKYLQEDLSYLVTHHPQVIISDFLLKYLKENPSEINTILP
jgi:hypothetical protein